MRVLDTPPLSTIYLVIYPEIPASSCRHRWCPTLEYGYCCWANRARLRHQGFLRNWSSSRIDGGRAPGPDAGGSCPSPGVDTFPSESIYFIRQSFCFLHVWGIDVITNHQGFCSRSGQAWKCLPQEGGDFQKELAGSHLQGKGTSALRRIDGIFESKIKTHKQKLYNHNREKNIYFLSVDYQKARKNVYETNFYQLCLIFGGQNQVYFISQLKCFCIKH